jgi:hypothetical protein
MKKYLVILVVLLAVPVIAYGFMTPVFCGGQTVAGGASCATNDEQASGRVKRYLRLGHNG